MKILLVDGNNLTWRAFGRAPLVFNGQRTEVIKIGVMMMRSYLEQFRPDLCYVVWDGGRNQKRKDLYPDYKKKPAPKTPVEQRELQLFFDQLGNLHDALLEMGIDQIRCRGQEADDVLYSLVKGYSPKDEVTVVSTDGDMIQLFLYHSGVRVWFPHKEKLISNSTEAEALFGVPLKYYITYKAMVGDPSDNLPGVKGIGPKGAMEMIGWLETGIDTQQSHKILEKWDEEAFKKMCALISFIGVSTQEILEGWMGASRELDDLYANALKVCETYGFEQWLDSMANFINPFDSYVRRRRTEICGL